MGIKVVRIVEDSDTLDDIVKEVLPAIPQTISATESLPEDAGKAENIPLQMKAQAAPPVDLVPTRSPLRTRVRTAIFCGRCRGLEIGRNRRYLIHRLLCFGAVSKSLRVAVCAALTTLALSILLAAKNGSAPN